MRAATSSFGCPANLSGSSTAARMSLQSLRASWASVDRRYCFARENSPRRSTPTGVSAQALSGSREGDAVSTKARSAVARDASSEASLTAETASHVTAGGASVLDDPDHPLASRLSDWENQGDASELAGCAICADPLWEAASPRHSPQPAAG